MVRNHHADLVQRAGPAQLAHGLGHAGLDAVLARDVHDDRTRPDLGRGGAHPVGVDVGDGDGGALGDIRLGEGAADAAGGAGDQRGLAVKPHAASPCWSKR